MLSSSVLSPLHHIYTVCVCLCRHQATRRALLPSSGSDFSDIPTETSAMCRKISTLFFLSFKLQDVQYFVIIVYCFFLNESNQNNQFVLFFERNIIYWRGDIRFPNIYELRDKFLPSYFASNYSADLSATGQQRLRPMHCTMWQVRKGGGRGGKSRRDSQVRAQYGQGPSASVSRLHRA